jgi:hypothetical protein
MQTTWLSLASVQVTMGSFGDEPSYETWDVGWPLTVEILPYHYKVIDCFFFHPSIQLFICKLSDDLEPHKPLHGLKHGFAIKKSLVYHHCSPYRENPNSFKPGTLLTGSPWFETNRCYTVIVTMKCIKKRICLHRKLLIAKAHSSLGATDGRRRCAWGTSSCFLHCCMHHMQIVRSWTERWLCWFFRHILHVFLMLDSLLGSASQLVTW